MLDQREQAREKTEASIHDQAELGRIAAIRFSAGSAHLDHLIVTVTFFETMGGLNG
jgi:hypothetical protein